MTCCSSLLASKLARFSFEPETSLGVPSSCPSCSPCLELTHWSFFFFLSHYSILVTFPFLLLFFVDGLGVLHSWPLGDAVRDVERRRFIKGQHFWYRGGLALLSYDE